MLWYLIYLRYKIIYIPAFELVALTSSHLLIYYFSIFKTIEKMKNIFKRKIISKCVRSLSKSIHVHSQKYMFITLRDVFVRYVLGCTVYYKSSLREKAITQQKTCNLLTKPLVI